MSIHLFPPSSLPPWTQHISYNKIFQSFFPLVCACWIQYILWDQYPVPRSCIVTKFHGKVELVWKVVLTKSFTNSGNFKLFSQLDKLYKLLIIFDWKVVVNLPVTQVSSPSPCLVSFTHWARRVHPLRSLCFSLISPFILISGITNESHLPHIGVSIGENIHPSALPATETWQQLSSIRHDICQNVYTSRL